MPPTEPAQQAQPGDVLARQLEQDAALVKRMEHEAAPAQDTAQDDVLAAH